MQAGFSWLPHSPLRPISAAGLPPAIVVRLNSEIGAILREPDAVQRLAADAAQPVIISAEAFARVIADDVAKWVRVAKHAGVEAQ